MKNSRGQQLLDTFRALSGAHFMYTNSTPIGVEMKKLLPLEANNTKLKANFAAAKSQGASC